MIRTGAGDRAIIAGADITELADIDANHAEARARAGQDLFLQIETLGTPVIAAINGVALGGGCEAALACTVRIAVPAAKFGLPEARLGLIPGFGGTQRLPRLVGRGNALRMILTADPIDAHEAWRIGLVDELAEPADLLPRAIALLHQIARNAPLAIGNAIRAVNAAMDTPLSVGLALERRLFSRCAGTADKAEGTATFLEKRAPQFRGI